MDIGDLGRLMSGPRVIHMPALPDDCIAVSTKIYEQLRKLRTPDDALLTAVNNFNNGRCSTCGGLRDLVSGDIVHNPDCKA